MKEREYWVHKVKDHKKQDRIAMEISKKVINVLDKSYKSRIAIKDTFDDDISITDEYLYIGASLLWDKNVAKSNAYYNSIIERRIKEGQFEKDIVSKSIEVKNILGKFGSNPILRMPRYVEGVTDIAYVKGIEDELADDESKLLCDVLNAVFAYLGSKVLNVRTSKSTTKLEDLDDELLILCIYTVLYWYMSDSCKLHKAKDFIELIKANLGETWEDAINKEIEAGNRFAKSYLEFKKNEKLNNEDNNYEPGIKFIEDVVTDFHKLNLSDFDITDFKSEISPYFVRSAEVSFEDCCANDKYKELNSIEDKFFKQNIFDLINKYLVDYADFLYQSAKFSFNRERCTAFSFELERRGFKRDKDELLAMMDRNKTKLKALKGDLKESEKKLEYLKQENKKLREKLAKLSDIELTKKDKEIETLKVQIDELHKNENKHCFEVDRLNDIIAKSNNKVKELETEIAKVKNNKNSNDNKECTEDIKITSSSREIPVDALYNTFKHKRILLIGGDTIHKNIIKRGYDCIEPVKSSDVNFKISGSCTYDVMVVFTKFVGHSVVERAESEARNSNLPVIRFNSAGINSLIHFLFLYFFSPASLDAGEYIL